eukprot:gene23668-biopygen10374
MHSLELHGGARDLRAVTRRTRGSCAAVGRRAHPRYTADAGQVHARCIQGASQVHGRYAEDAPRMHGGCTEDACRTQEDTVWMHGPYGCTESMDARTVRRHEECGGTKGEMGWRGEGAPELTEATMAPATTSARAGAFASAHRRAMLCSVHPQPFSYLLPLPAPPSSLLPALLPFQVLPTPSTPFCPPPGKWSGRLTRVRCEDPPLNLARRPGFFYNDLAIGGRRQDSRSLYGDISESAGSSFDILRGGGSQPEVVFWRDRAQIFRSTTGSPPWTPLEPGLPAPSTPTPAHLTPRAASTAAAPSQPAGRRASQPRARTRSQ